MISSALKKVLGIVAASAAGGFALGNLLRRGGQPAQTPPAAPEDLAGRIAHLETRLLRDLEAELDRRINRRFAPIEAEIASQRISVGELRDHSLRTERSLQKLLEGVERLIASQNAPAQTGRSNGSGTT